MIKGIKLLLIWGLFLRSSFGEPLKLEAFGDSLTAGFLADTSLIHPKPFSDLGPLLQELAFGFIQKDREVLKKYEANHKAWPHFLSELLRARGIELTEVANLAISGSRSSAVDEQVKRRGKILEPSWSFFFIGHNDLCHVKGEEEKLVGQYQINLEKALREWDKNHTQSVAFLIPTGPIHQLYPVLEDTPWISSSSKVFYCQDAWMKYFPYCPSFYIRYKRGELENYLKPRGEAMNRSLEKIADSVNKESLNANRYVFLESGWPLPLQREYFALDCYHIAEAGQQKFAQNVYNALLSAGILFP